MHHHCVDVITEKAAKSRANGTASSKEGHQQAGRVVTEAQQLQPQGEEDHGIPGCAAHYSLHRHPRQRLDQQALA